MAKELAPISDRDQQFIESLLENGGNVQAAARDVGINGRYAYQMQKRLFKHIAEAAQHYLALHSVKAASSLVGEMIADVPNPVRLTACQAVLDRAGVIRKDYQEEEIERPTIKANIFILPEKRIIQELIIDNE